MSKVALLIIGRAAVTIGKCIVRVYFNGLGIISNGLSKVALLGIGSPTVSIGHCEFRIYFYGFGKIINGLG